MSNRKDITIHLEVLDGIKVKINVKADLSSYATKINLKNVAHVDTSSFALKTNL